MNKQKFLIGVILLFVFFFSLNVVCAETTPLVGTSDAGVEYDRILITQFLENHWVYVMVDMKDFSNVSIDYENDSIELQAEKDNQRWNTYRNTSGLVLSTLSEDEFRLKTMSEWGTFFSGNITKEGFNKLLNDERVEHVYSKKYGHINSGSIIFVSGVYVLPIILLIVIVVLLVELKRRKWKIKEKF